MLLVAFEGSGVNSHVLHLFDSGKNVDSAIDSVDSSSKMSVLLLDGLEAS
jgi:hypothetical protein